MSSDVLNRLLETRIVLPPHHYWVAKWPMPNGYIAWYDGPMFAVLGAEFQPRHEAVAELVSFNEARERIRLPPCSLSVIRVRGEPEAAVREVSRGG